MSTDEAVFHGAAKLDLALARAAIGADIPIVAGPLWNKCDRLVSGDAQCLHFALRGSFHQELFFNTRDLKQYAEGDAETTARIHGFLEHVINTQDGSSLTAGKPLRRL